MSYGDRIARVAVLIAFTATAVGAVSLPAATSMATVSALDAATGHGHDHIHGSSLFLPPLSSEGEPPPPEVLEGGPVKHHVGDRLVARTEDAGTEVFTTGQTAFEPTIGFTEKGSLFFQAQGTPADDPSGEGGLLSYPIVLRSPDRGITWEDVSPKDGDERRHQVTWDPYLYADPATSRVFTVDWQPNTCSMISYSDDDGTSWTTNLAACGLADHQNIFAGPPAFSTTTGYPNIVYYCSIGFGAMAANAGSGCQKSLDGGNTFIPVSPPFMSDPVNHEGGLGDIRGFCGAALAPGYVDAEGTVYVPSQQCGHPWLAISRNEGLTWERVRVNSELGSAEGEGGLTPETEATGFGFPTESTRAVYGHEAGFGADAEGNLYYAWDAHDRHIYLSVSRDSGRSWTPPVSVSPPNVIEAGFPTLVVGSPGRVAVAYVGRENAPGPRPCPNTFSGCSEPTSDRYKDATWTGYISVTDDAFAEQPRFVTGAASPPEEPYARGYCSPIRCLGMGDFFDVVIGPDGHPWASFADHYHCATDPDRDPEEEKKCAGPSFTSAIGVVMHMTSGPRLIHGPKSCPPGADRSGQEIPGCDQ